MRTIPSPHGGLLHHRHHRHEEALREHDRHRHDTSDRHEERHDERRGFGPRGHGHGHGRHHGHEHHHGRRHHHDRGERFGRGRNPLAPTAFDREEALQVAQAGQQIRAATRSLLHHGTPEQLAEAQRLLEDTRRALYLILADELQPATGEQTADIGEPASPGQEGSAEATAPPEIGGNPET